MSCSIFICLLKDATLQSVYHIVAKLLRKPFWAIIVDDRGNCWDIELFRICGHSCYIMIHADSRYLSVYRCSPSYSQKHNPTIATASSTTHQYDKRCVYAQGEYQRGKQEILYSTHAQRTKIQIRRTILKFFLLLFALSHILYVEDGSATRMIEASGSVQCSSHDRR